METTAEQNREEIIADFKKWLEEHKEQFQEHISDELSAEDLDDDWKYEVSVL